MAAPDRANNPSRIIFDDIKGAKTGLFGDPVKEVLRYNPVTSATQQAYANAKQLDSQPLRGQEVTVKGVNDGWRTQRAIAQGFETVGDSQRVNPKTGESPKQTAYREARWAAGADKPLRGEIKEIKGLTSGWGANNPVVRGFGTDAAPKQPVKISSSPTLNEMKIAEMKPATGGRIATFFNGLKGAKGGGGFGGNPFGKID